MIINTVIIISTILTLSLIIVMINIAVKSGKTTKVSYVLSMAILSPLVGVVMTVIVVSLFTLYEAAHPRVVTESFTIGKDAVYKDESLIVTSLGIEREYEFPKLNDLDMTIEDIQGVEVKVDTLVYDFGILTTLFKLDTTRYVVRIEE